MLDYYDLLSAGEWDDLADARRGLGEGEGDPLSFKQTLASRVVARFHGEEAAQTAAAHFRSVIQGKGVPDEVPELRVRAEDGGAGLLATLVEAGVASSNGEARRLVAQGAVTRDGERISDPRCRLEPGGPYLLKVGKRRFVRVTVG
jgi:tyrosyl-tRNA synthetase